MRLLYVWIHVGSKPKPSVYVYTCVCVCVHVCLRMCGWAFNINRSIYSIMVDRNSNTHHSFNDTYILYSSLPIPLLQFLSPLLDTRFLIAHKELNTERTNMDKGIKLIAPTPLRDRYLLNRPWWYLNLVRSDWSNTAQPIARRATASAISPPFLTRYSHQI